MHKHRDTYIQSTNHRSVTRERERERKENVASHHASMAVSGHPPVCSDPFVCIVHQRIRSLFTIESLPPLSPFSPHSELIHTNIHGAKPRQKLINDISLRAMSERHPRRLPEFLSEEDPGSFMSEKERKKEREFKVNRRLQWLTPWLLV